MLKKLFTWCGMLITLALPLFLLFYLDPPVIKSTAIESRFSAISWLVTGVVGFLALVVLYLSIILENRVLKKIRGLNDYFQPYGFETADIYRKLHNYISKTGKYDLIFLYLVYLLAVNSLNILWVTLLKYYVPLSITEIFNFEGWGITLNNLSYFVFYSLSFSFILFSIIICFMLTLIINEQNLLGKYKLPKGRELFDVNYLLISEASVNEILKRSNPTLNIYYNEDNFEIYINSLLPIYNLTYHYKFYSYKDAFRLNIYQKISEGIVFEQNESVKLKEENYKLNIDFLTTKEIDEILSINVLKELIVYDYEGNIIAKFKLSLANHSLVIDRELPNPDKNLEKEKIKMINEETKIELS